MTKPKPEHLRKKPGRKRRKDDALLEQVAEEYLKGRSPAHSARAVAAMIDEHDHHDGTVRRRLSGKLNDEIKAAKVVWVGDKPTGEQIEIVPRLENAMVRLAKRRKKYLPDAYKTKSGNP